VAEDKDLPANKRTSAKKTNADFDKLNQGNEVHQ